MVHLRYVPIRRLGNRPYTDWFLPQNPELKRDFLKTMDESRDLNGVRILRARSGFQRPWELNGPLDARYA